MDPVVVYVPRCSKLFRNKSKSNLYKAIPSEICLTQYSKPADVEHACIQPSSMDRTLDKRDVPYASDKMNAHETQNKTKRILDVVHIY
jgi:hypothetical protein